MSKLGCLKQAARSALHNIAWYKQSIKLDYPGAKECTRGGFFREGLVERLIKDLPLLLQPRVNLYSSLWGKGRRHHGQTETPVWDPLQCKLERMPGGDHGDRSCGLGWMKCQPINQVDKDPYNQIPSGCILPVIFHALGGILGVWSQKDPNQGKSQSNDTYSNLNGDCRGGSYFLGRGEIL